MLSAGALPTRRADGAMVLACGCCWKRLQVLRAVGGLARCVKRALVRARTPASQVGELVVRVACGEPTVGRQAAGGPVSRQRATGQNSMVANERRPFSSRAGMATVAVAVVAAAALRARANRPAG